MSTEMIESELGWADMSFASFGEMMVRRDKKSANDIPVLVIALREKEMASEQLGVLLGYSGDPESTPDQWRFVAIGITWAPPDRGKS